MRRGSANGVSVSVSVFVRRERSLRRVEKKTPSLDERSCLVCVPGHLTRKPIWHARDTGRRFVSTSGAWGGASPRSRGGRARRRTVIIASRSSSYSADAASSGTHGESASAHAPAATRARAAEKMSHCRLSRATAREGITSGWERSGRDGTGERSARARSGIERVDEAVARASRVSSPGAVAGRARAGTRTGPVQSLSLACEKIFEEAAASVGKETYPRRPRGACRFGSSPPLSRRRSSARSTRGRIAPPRAAARPREVRPRSLSTSKRHRARRTSRRLACSCAARRGAFRAGRGDAGERAGSCGGYRAVGNSRDGSVARVLLGERRRVRECVGPPRRCFFKTLCTIFCRENSSPFARVLRASGRSTRAHLGKIFFSFELQFFESPVA